MQVSNTTAHAKSFVPRPHEFRVQIRVGPQVRHVSRSLPKIENEFAFAR
jgi:hypothetical protein